MAPERCPICNGLLTWQHDHRPDDSGVDDGPPLSNRGRPRKQKLAPPGVSDKPPRKKPDPKPPEVVAKARAEAWATRRAKYGKHGHRGSHSR